MTHTAAAADRTTRGRAVAGLVALLLLCGLLTPGMPQLGAEPAGAATCPCTIWPSTATPANPSDPDTSAVELGVKLRSDLDGAITGVRFYKGSGNTGTHVGNLWTADGTRLATATFEAETATGWQQVLFPNPVPITAGTTYVASYYAPNGRYAGDSGAFATSGVDNGPLHALADGVDGANGVYRYGTGGGFPQNSWQSANYWVDVVFETSATDGTAPTVVERAPAPDSTGVPVSTSVTASFDEPVSGAQVAVTGPAGAVSGTTTYDAPSRTVRFQPAAALATSTKHTATVSGAKDAAGNTMAPLSWSFTTAATAGGCPCSLWPTSTTPATGSANDNNAVELGVRFRSSSAGYVTGLRFYKGSANTGTHVGSLWRTDGTKLASATFTGESASGWQTVVLPSPVPVAAATDYVASYHAPNGGYAVDYDHFTAARTNGPLSAPASSSATPNGVYRYGASGYPTGTYRSSNYWVDVVFDTAAADTTAPTVTGHSPVAGATAVDPGSSMTATFSEAVSPSSVAFSVSTQAGAQVTGTTTYDSSTQTATFVPGAALAAGTTYNASVTASDTAGNDMSTPVTWTFTTSVPSPVTTADGPVLVVTPTGPGFGGYLTEILKNEGLNAHATGGLDALTKDNLARYDMVVLAQTTLTAAQVGVLTDWVTAGGNLVAMRPDRGLSGLLGLTAQESTTAEGYLKVDITTAPGAGITGETMQFHGAADHYALNGAASVATLYMTATTATSSPAVSLRSVGTNGGQAAAFTYDLASSIVHTRQGNRAWAGQERDGNRPVRSNDMFWGTSATNGYVNLDKVAIPQADEQQRLLANLVQTMNRDRKPLPRFWYFPRMHKALVVATGDDHGNGGTAGRYDQYKANSPANCSMVLWTCSRFSSYIYTSTPLTAAQARSYDAEGFETGLHPSSGCSDFTPASLDTNYSSQLAEWKTKYTGVPAPPTTRFHCIVFSDWASQPKVQRTYGMGMDTNYYYWPGSWVTNRPGFMTGSGMPMRFADADGTIIDNYQAATQMTDESGQSYPMTPNTLLDNALGDRGYYGAFTANLHTDQATIWESDQVLASARSRGVPIITARQLLTWTQGRDASRFSDVTWSGDALSFGIAPASGAEGLMAMLPTAGPKGALSAISRSGTEVSFTKQTVKGIEYAVFPAAAGAYTATYAAAAVTASATSTTEATSPSSTTSTSDGSSTVLASAWATAPLRAVGLASVQTSSWVRIALALRAQVSAARAATAGAAAPPAITDVHVASSPDGTATVTWRTDEASDSMVRFGSAPGLRDSRRDADLVTEHSVVLTGLEAGRTYGFEVRSTDADGNVGVAPPSRFVQSAPGVADTSAASLRTGRSDAGGHIASRQDGELRLSADEVQEFEDPRLPDTWQTEQEGGGRTVVYGGRMSVDGTRVLAIPRSGPRTIEFQATFTAGQQSAGLAAGPGAPGAVVENNDGRLFAVVGAGRSAVATALADGLVGAPHTYRIEWDGSTATVFVDGTRVASGALRSTTPLRPLVRDLKGDDAPLTLGWLEVSAFRPATTYESRVLDAQQMVDWDRATWEADVPSGTTLVVSVRTGDRRTPDDTWGGWTTLAGSGARVVGSGRFLQYKVELATKVSNRTPVLRSIGFTHNGVLPHHEGEVR